MSQTAISDDLRQRVINRAQGKCEYCLLHQDFSIYVHEIDHIIALKHNGQTVADNLALACLSCNRHKGSDLATFDPLTQKLVRLFDPRHQSWTDHFALKGYYLIGLTPTGRATVFLLKFNQPRRLGIRQSLTAFGQYP